MIKKRIWILEFISGEKCLAAHKIIDDNIRFDRTYKYYDERLYRILNPGNGKPEVENYTLSDHFYDVTLKISEQACRIKIDFLIKENSNLYQALISYIAQWKLVNFHYWYSVTEELSCT